MHALTLIPLLLVLGWLLGPAGLLLLVVALVAATIIAGLLHASPRPPELRIGLPARLVCWVEEIIAGLLIIFVTMPFERLMMPRDLPARRDDAHPVLLIHGYINNAGALFGLYDELARQGYGVYTINLEPVHGDIDRHAARIEARVESILESSGAGRVTLVAHSMGGLAARAYLRAFPRAPVAQLITLGSPHQGTPAAYTAWGTAGKQMRPGSAWLGELGRDEGRRLAETGARWPCAITTLYSMDDNIAFPQLCARLEGAREIAIAGVGHMSMPMSRRVARLVIKELT
jgi:triacylglycerol esterase/lipase EstA (alpha/beta hydrolase family)